jgi:hypothetical protein
MTFKLITNTKPYSRYAKASFCNKPNKIYINIQRNINKSKNNFIIIQVMIYDKDEEIPYNIKSDIRFINFEFDNKIVYSYFYIDYITFMTKNMNLPKEIKKVDNINLHKILINDIRVKSNMYDLILEYICNKFYVNSIYAIYFEKYKIHIVFNFNIVFTSNRIYKIIDNLELIKFDNTKYNIYKFIINNHDHYLIEPK